MSCIWISTHATEGRAYSASDSRGHLCSSQKSTAAGVLQDADLTPHAPLDLLKQMSSVRCGYGAGPCDLSPGVPSMGSVRRQLLDANAVCT